MQTLQELRMRTAYMMEEMRRRAIDETLENSRWLPGIITKHQRVAQIPQNISKN